jgi:hypothetical protein
MTGNATNLCAFALLISVGIALTPTASRAAICPQYLAKYCVVTASGHRMTALTNPCFAKQKHWRILYRGACHK